MDIQVDSGMAISGAEVKKALRDVFCQEEIVGLVFAGAMTLHKAVTNEIAMSEQNKAACLKDVAGGVGKLLHALNEDEQKLIIEKIRSTFGLLIQLTVNKDLEKVAESVH